MLINDYRPNDPYKYCDICGLKWRASETRLNWKRQIVCKLCYEPKHPSLNRKPLPKEQDYIRDARPAPTEVFVEPGDITGSDL